MTNTIELPCVGGPLAGTTQTVSKLFPFGPPLWQIIPVGKRGFYRVDDFHEPTRLEWVRCAKREDGTATEGQ